MPNEQTLKDLIDMGMQQLLSVLGFEREDCLRALKNSNNNKERALNALIYGDSAASAAFAFAE